MKKLIFHIFFLLLSSVLFAQESSNSWINYNQKYYRIPITNSGVYRITYADLQANSISPGDFDSRYLEMYYKGQAIPIVVYGEEDGIFNLGDYIEFYASENNSASIDSSLYKTKKSLNPYVSLFNDTASYFITFSQTLPVSRYRTITPQNFVNYDSLQYCIYKTTQSFSDIYNAAGTSPYYMPGEGWCGNEFNLTSQIKYLNTSKHIQVGIPSKLSFGITGFSSDRHDITVQLNNPYARFDSTYWGHNVIHKTITTSNPLISLSEVSFTSNPGYNKLVDRNCIAYVEIEYTHSYDFNAQNTFSFKTPKTESGDSLLIHIRNFNGGNDPLMFIPELNLRIKPQRISSGFYKVLIPNTNKELQCYIANQSTFLSASTIYSVKSKNNSDSKFFDVTATENEGEYIIITHKSLWPSAFDYSTYRKNKGLKVVLIDVQEIYNQFGYGVQKHPLAIKNFIDYAYANWTTKPVHVFIVGKGYNLQAFKKNTTIYANTLIPALTYPPSDFLYTTDLEGKNMICKTTIGRIAAKSGSEVYAYLNKVIEHELQPSAAWMKNVLHFGGGTDAGQQATLKGYLSNYEKIMEDVYFGANVVTFLKQTSDVFEKTEPEVVREYMNTGTSMLTFFGHAAGSGFDQSIDEPTSFTNQGKYPLFLANSCYSGDIFSDNPSGLNEKWILTPNRGAIGFIAKVDEGRVTYLNLFSSSFIKNIANYNYNGTIGSSLAYTLNELGTKYKGFTDVYSEVLTFAFHGDPLIKLHSPNLPDLEVNETSFIFEPSIISTDLNSFNSKIIVKNNGKAIKDTCNLRLTFTSSSGKIISVDTLISNLYLKDTISFNFQTKFFEAGDYTITAHIDTELEIDEYEELNNIGTIDFFISTRDILPIYPQKFAIIPTDTITLYASAVDATVPSTNILFELDTSILFNSFHKDTRSIKNNTSAIVSWKPTIKFIENAVYYWRVSDADKISWNLSSFVYEKDKTGWCQKHPYQFTENTLENVEFNVETNTYSFVNSPREISGYTKNLVMPKMGGGLYPDAEYFESKILLDGEQLATSGVNITDPAIHVVVLDSATVDPWTGDRGNYGHQNYPTWHGRTQYMFSFRSNTEAGLNSFANFVENIVPNNNHIYIYTFGNIPILNPQAVTALENLGAKEISSPTLTNFAYLMYCKKGDVTTIKETINTTSEAKINMPVTINTSYFKGSIQTPKIGPAKTFYSAEWNDQKLDIIDTSNIKITGYLHDKTSYTAVPETSIRSIDKLDTLINTSIIPQLSIKYTMEDYTFRTPSLLHEWKVYFDPIAELAIQPTHKFKFHADTIQEGEMLTLQIAAKNISTVEMDSVLVLFEIYNEQNQLVYTEYNKTAPSKPKKSVIANLNYNTKGLKDGNYILRVEFNPYNKEIEEYDQYELEHFNNSSYYPFTITKDITKPSLDVILDGRHILNNDYISPTPKILISLYDENPFIFTQDTSSFTIKVTNKTTNVTTRYYFNSTQLTLIPASSTNKTAYVLFTPTFTEDGIYELEVQAEDYTGNISGDNSYTINFTINTEQKISRIYNYPNPSTYYTTFKFTVTGIEAPEFVNLKIYSNEGKQIKTLRITNVHIGVNIIDIYLDNRDSNGLSLAPGTYYYTIEYDKTKYNHLSTPNDAIFKFKDYGTMIITR